MTVSVQKALDKLCNDEIFNDELYFSGGTALAYYLKHRISEDIDIISSKYKSAKCPDLNRLAVRMLSAYAINKRIPFLYKIEQESKL